MASYLAENREPLSVSTVRMWARSTCPTSDCCCRLPGAAMVIVVFEKDLQRHGKFFFVFPCSCFTLQRKQFYLVVGLGLITVGAPCAAYAASGHVQVRVNTWPGPVLGCAEHRLSAMPGAYLSPTATCSARPGQRPAGGN